MTKNVGDYQRRIAEVGSHLAGYALQLDEKKAAQEQEALALAAAQEDAPAADDPGTEAVQPDGNGAGNGTAANGGVSQTAPGSTPNAGAAPENAADAHPMALMIAAVGLTGLFMLAVGLAAEAGGRSTRRKRKK